MVMIARVPLLSFVLACCVSRVDAGRVVESDSLNARKRFVRDPLPQMCVSTFRGGKTPIPTDGECQCDLDKGYKCFENRELGCNDKAKAKNHETFDADCTSCHCNKACPADSSSAKPNGNSDCLCDTANSFECYNGKHAGCPNSDGADANSKERFGVSCPTCQCLKKKRAHSQFSRGPPTLPPSIPLKAPKKSRGSPLPEIGHLLSCHYTAASRKQDKDGMCHCKSGETCYSTVGKKFECKDYRRSGEVYTDSFPRKCAWCSCANPNGGDDDAPWETVAQTVSNPTSSEPTTCPEGSLSEQPRNGECICDMREGLSCVDSTISGGCADSDGDVTDEVFLVTCKTCKCV